MVLASLLPDHGYKVTRCLTLQLESLSPPTLPHPKGLLPQTVSLMQSSFLKLVFFFFLVKDFSTTKREVTNTLG